MEFLVQLATIITLIFTGYQVYMARKENKDKELKELTKRRRKFDVLTNELSVKSNYIKQAFLKFEHNYKMYLSMQDKNTIESKLDTIAYYILSYVNKPFIENIISTKETLDNFYQDSISDKDINYETYVDINNELNIIIEDLKIALLVSENYIPSYDEKLISETRNAVINKKDTKDLSLINENFNGQGNVFIANPLMYYKDILFKYRFYFHKNDDIPVFLIDANKQVGKVRVFTEVFDYEKTHNKIRDLITELNYILKNY
ncbi:hypothetical protein PXW92_03825 [Staphylococcus hominis]|uniref:hypothetical protein n=1 Tax=Staphylococcus hominis TaxID=1290 RepID=UPI0012DE27B4|nr:hypothetical protein [Staphylococcus hominis]MDS0980516.1 hypothetical protein [Staphylococcus hominis]QGR78511.1 hypothetical protein FOC54_00450 [Staphylococcus hominis]